jgi:hypothetical protein
MFIFIWWISCKSSLHKRTVLSHLFRHLRQQAPFYTVNTNTKQNTCILRHSIVQYIIMYVYNTSVAV